MTTRRGHSGRFIAAGAILALAASAGHAQIAATWINTTSDNWSSITAWDINPVFPNNFGPNTYDAFIGPSIVGTSNFTVSLDQPITIESLFLTQSFTFLDLTTNTLTLNQDLTITDASVVGTLGGGSVLSVAGNVNLTRAFFMWTTLETSAGSSITFGGGGGDSTIICDTDVNHRGFAALDGDEELIVMGGSDFRVLPTGTLALRSPNGQVTGLPGGGGSPQLIIEGTLLQDQPGASSTISGLNLVNQGLLEVSAGTLSTDSVTLPGGVLAEGTWRVTNGATLDLQSTTITTNATTVELDGPGSTFTALNSIATNEAAGTLRFTNGSDFTTASDFTNNGTLEVGSATTFTVATGSTLTNAAGGTLAGGTYDIAGILRFDNADITTLGTEVLLTGPTAAIEDQIGQNALRNLDTIDTAGDLTLAAGAGLFINNDLTLATTGRLEVDTGSTFEVDQNFTITNFSGGTFTGGVFDIRGTVIFNASVETLEGDFTLDGPTSNLIRPAGVGGGDVFAPLNLINPAGSLTLRNGRDLTLAGPLNVLGNLNIESGPPDAPSTLTVPGNLTQTSGTVSLVAGGVLKVGTSGNGAYLLQGGTLAGSGQVVGNIIQTGGTISPGNSAGTLSIDGDWTIDVGSGVKIELGGVAAGASDFIDLTGDLSFGSGSLNLAGTLTLSMLDGYVPSFAGDTIEIIRAQSRSGQFASVQGPMLGSVPLFSVSYTTTSVWVTIYAIPAPASGLALLGLLLPGRRRR